MLAPQGTSTLPDVNISPRKALFLLRKCVIKGRSRKKCQVRRLEKRFQVFFISRGWTLTSLWEKGKNKEVELCFKGDSSSGRLKDVFFCDTNAFRGQQGETWQMRRRCCLLALSLILHHADAGKHNMAQKLKTVGAKMNGTARAFSHWSAVTRLAGVLGPYR